VVAWYALMQLPLFCLAGVTGGTGFTGATGSTGDIGALHSHFTLLWVICDDVAALQLSATWHVVASNLGITFFGINILQVPLACKCWAPIVQ
jgi:hypothetical protein